VLGTYLLTKAFLNQSPAPTGTPVLIAISSAASHAGPWPGPMSGYGASKLAAASAIEYLQAENPKLKAFNVHPGIVGSDINDKAAQPHLPPRDSPELVAHTAVWLAGPDSDFLKGHYLWANWDVEELIKAKDKIAAAPELFHLTLEGWSNTTLGYSLLRYFISRQTKLLGKYKLLGNSLPRQPRSARHCIIAVTPMLE
jgi:hypothetical protein